MKTERMIFFMLFKEEKNGNLQDVLEVKKRVRMRHGTPTHLRITVVGRAVPLQIYRCSNVDVLYFVHQNENKVIYGARKQLLQDLRYYFSWAEIWIIKSYQSNQNINRIHAESKINSTHPDKKSHSPAIAASGVKWKWGQVFPKLDCAKLMIANWCITNTLNCSKVPESPYILPPACISKICSRAFACHVDMQDSTYNLYTTEKYQYPINHCDIA